MKRFVLLVLCFLAVALVATVFGVGGTAFAEDVVTQQYVTEHYIDLGEIYTISAYRGSAAVLRAEDDQAYLTVLGETQLDLALPLEVASLSDVQFAYYDGYVFLYNGDQLTLFDCTTGATRDTKIPTSMPFLSTSIPLTGFAVDEGMVYVSYQFILAWVPFDKVFDEGDLYEDRSLNLGQAPTSFSAHKGVCYFYVDSGAAFTADTQTKEVSETVPVGALDAFDYADRLLYLRGGVVEVEDEEQLITLLPKSSAAFATDRFLRNATAISTSFDDTTWRIWVVDKGQSAVKVFDADGNYLTMYGTYGADDGRLNSPSSIALGDHLAAIIDDANARTVVLNLDTGAYLHFNGLASSVATAGSRVYIAEEDLVTAYDYSRPSLPTAPYTQTIYYLPADVVSVCSDGVTVYALTTDCLYVLRSSEDAVAQIYVHAVAAKAGRHTGIVYIQTDRTITPFKDMQEVGVSVDVSDLDVLDFDVDYCGNVYVLTVDGALYVYQRIEAGYQRSSLALTAPLRALSITADGLVYGLSQSALVSLDIPVRTRLNSAYPEPQWDQPVSVVQVTDAVWGYASPNNYESVVRVPAGTYAMRMADHTYQGVDYYYIEFALSIVGNVRYERVYVPRTAATQIAYTEPTDMYVRYDGAAATTGVYPYPSYSATATTTVPKADATFKVLRIMGVQEGQTVWSWYMVEVSDGVAGYVAADNYVTAEPPYREVERYYARCVAGKLGEKVSVYALPDEGSEVVASLVDGTKIELTAPYDADSRFTCIRLDDREVYILTANVTTRSLTGGQTFALILSVVVICAAAVTLVLYLLVKKRR